MDNSEENDDDGGGGGGLNLEQLKSYLAFAKYALRKAWLTSVVVLVSGLVLTVLAFLYLPRTFSCTTVLMTMGNPVLDGRDGSNALAGATDLITRHENLESMIREIGLIKKIESRRPPLLHLKDRISRAISGPMSEKIQMASLVGSLETKVLVTEEKGDLTIKVDWTDARTAQELAEAARESFLRERHTAEISAFEEKTAILDGHASKLREEIGGLAQQLKSARDEKLTEVRQEQSQTNKASADAAAAAQPRVFVRSAPRRAPIEPDTQTPELRAKLETLKAKLSAIEADRDQRLRAEQAKLEDLKLRLTPSHPEVVTEEQKIGMLQQVPSDVALLRAEAKDLEAEIQQREGLSRQGGGDGILGGGGGAKVPGTSADPLPPDITDLLQRDNLDPALTAQLSSTVLKYSALRNDLLTTRIELDTAQAAFNHRYQIIIPAELPNKPDKPKPAVIIGAGLALSILLSLLLPTLKELRRGVIVERWQVEHLQLPILAELRLPPYSPD